jgi:hypothetical protein
MRRFVFAPEIDDAGPVWQGGDPAEQGYSLMPIPKLRRQDAKANEYYVYSNSTEYKAIEAESAIAAVTNSQIPSPFKVMHMHMRLADVIDSQKLEYINNDTEHLNGKDLESPKIVTTPDGQAGTDAPPADVPPVSS